MFALAVAGAYMAGRADVTMAPKLENARVKVSQMDYQPGKPRAKSIRASDQVIVFLDDSRYERTDPDTGAKVCRFIEMLEHTKGRWAAKHEKIVLQVVRWICSQAWAVWGP